MTISYLVMGFFAVIGFFRGWWKEAITTFLLALLVLLLQQPAWAQTIIDWLNQGIAVILSFLANNFGVTLTTDTAFQVDPSRPGTWLVILFLILGLSSLLARFFLPATLNRLPSLYYTVTPIGRVLGLLVGGLNGFLIINLVREYLDGRSLPGNTPVEASITQAGSSSTPALPTLTIQAVNLPGATILDSYIPWLIIGGGFLILFAVLWTRIKLATKPGAGSKIVYVSPPGYKLVPAVPPPPPASPPQVRIVS
ncbi:MAG: hypothetical protein HYR94_13090 [Chloroflexi bacterium]|nr:hypothetical protein [Chloroflexota bacterium]